MELEIIDIDAALAEMEDRDETRAYLEYARNVIASAIKEISSPGIPSVGEIEDHLKQKGVEISRSFIIEYVSNLE